MKPVPLAVVRSCTLTRQPSCTKPWPMRWAAAWLDSGKSACALRLKACRLFSRMSSLKLRRSAKYLGVCRVKHKLVLMTKKARMIKNHQAL